MLATAWLSLFVETQLELSGSFLLGLQLPLLDSCLRAFNGFVEKIPS